MKKWLVGLVVVSLFFGVPVFADIAPMPDHCWAARNLDTTPGCSSTDLQNYAQNLRRQSTQNNALVIGGIVVGSLVFVGLGVLAGILIYRSSKQKQLPTAPALGAAPEQPVEPKS